MAVYSLSFSFSLLFFFFSSPCFTVLKSRIATEIQASRKRMEMKDTKKNNNNKKKKKKKRTVTLKGCYKCTSWYCGIKMEIKEMIFLPFPNVSSLWQKSTDVTLSK